MTDDPLQHKSHTDFHPHTTTMAAGARVAKYAQSIATRDKFASQFHMTHVIENPYGKRIGTYTLWVRYRDGDKEGDAKHTFNLELMLSMRDDWKQYVEKHVLKAMKECVYAVG